VARHARARDREGEARARASCATSAWIDLALGEAERTLAAEELEGGGRRLRARAGSRDTLLQDLEASRAAIVLASAAGRERDARAQPGASRARRAELGAPKRSSAARRRRSRRSSIRQPSATSRAASEGLPHGARAGGEGAREARARRRRCAAHERSSARAAAAGRARARDCAAARRRARPATRRSRQLDAPTALAHFRIARRAMRTRRSRSARCRRSCRVRPHITARVPAADRVSAQPQREDRVSRSRPATRTATRSRTRGRWRQAAGTTRRLRSPCSRGRHARGGRGFGREGGVGPGELARFVREPPAELHLYPDEKSARLELGGSREFRADATRPRRRVGDRRASAVDGKSVAAGDGSRSQRARPARYVIAARAVDAGGAQTTLRARVEVSSENAGRRGDTEARTGARATDPGRRRRRTSIPRRARRSARSLPEGLSGARHRSARARLG
jgi:hypothetical protein